MRKHRPANDHVKALTRQFLIRQFAAGENAQIGVQQTRAVAAGVVRLEGKESVEVEIAQEEPRDTAPTGAKVEKIGAGYGLSRKELVRRNEFVKLRSLAQRGFARAAVGAVLQ